VTDLRHCYPDDYTGWPKGAITQCRHIGAGRESGRWYGLPVIGCPADAADVAEELAWGERPPARILYSLPDFVIADAIGVAERTGYTCRARWLRHHALPVQEKLL